MLLASARGGASTCTALRRDCRRTCGGRSTPTHPSLLGDPEAKLCRRRCAARSTADDEARRPDGRQLEARDGEAAHGTGGRSPGDWQQLDERPTDSQQEQLWHVPWDEWHTAGVMVQLWALMLPLGFGGVAIIGQMQGLTAATMGPTDRAVAAVASEVLQLGGAAYVLRGACSRYQPLQQPWFQYRLDAKGVANGIAAGVASLAAVSLAATALAALLQQAVAEDAAQAVPRSQVEIGGILGSGGAVGTAAAAAASILLAPALEELVYRGFLLPSLSNRLPTAAAVALSSALFATAHLSAADAAPLFVLGCMLGVSTVAAEGNLVAPTLAHALYNAAVFLAVAEQSSGPPI